MALTLSTSLVTGMETHEHVRIAEDLGYERAWLYDSPPLTADVWVQLCRAAERTSRIGLGPGVAVPSLRHPLTTAAAVATLVGIAGDRVVLGVGTGFTARLMMGQKPLTWRATTDWIAAVRGLLAGGRVTWEGQLVEMGHWPGVLPELPLTVPLVLAVTGPKGIGIAHDIADGVMGAVGQIDGFDWSVVLALGTVLRRGEDVTSERVMAAAGHTVALLYHWGVEQGVETLPRSKEYAESWADCDPAERHLLLHHGHLSGLSEHDRARVTPDLLAATGAALSPAGWRERLAALEEGGATEVTYQPAGDDIRGELEAFAEAARG